MTAPRLHDRPRARAAAAAIALCLSGAVRADGDAADDPKERNDLARDPAKHEAPLLRMNGLLDDLVARDVGKNDGHFLPAPARPAGVVCCD